MGEEGFTLFTDFGNPQVADLPVHLRQYIVPQGYERYTPVDQAVWRYVMRQNYHHLKDIAYYPYIPGLKAAGLTIEKIPTLQEMNDALGRIGWGAVTVDGFIPPAAFMEYQANRVLVIAADIRQLEHIGYTPAPDILHESAGHAPIIAEPDYNQYLSYFGSIGSKALFSAEDFALYEAIRAVSILKEMPDADKNELKEAEARLAWQQENMGEPSEMALLSRLHWWTVEYGLIGIPENPKIFGAGLLSSIGESAACMRSGVKKIPYSEDAVHFTYDITRPQPQLFVTPDFPTLTRVLDNFADKMAFRRGGMYGLQKAIDSRNVCTAVYSSGLQVSGVFTKVIEKDGEPVYLKTDGPTALACDDRQLEGHGKTGHKMGFGSPVGPIKGFAGIPDKQMLEQSGLFNGTRCSLAFESGITVKGMVKSMLCKQGNVLLITLSGCTVSTADGQVLFKPEWGEYDLALGERIVSVFSGAADKSAFETTAYRPATQTRHVVYSGRQKELHEIYKAVRLLREGRSSQDPAMIWTRLRQQFPDDWLCALEILELIKRKDPGSTLEKEVQNELERMADKRPELSGLIGNGLRLAAKN